MPAMVRDPKSKATKIAYSILGIPNNIRFPKSIFSEDTRKRLEKEYRKPRS